MPSKSFNYGFSSFELYLLCGQALRVVKVLVYSNLFCLSVFRKCLKRREKIFSDKNVFVLFVRITTPIRTEGRRKLVYKSKFFMSKMKNWLNIVPSSFENSCLNIQKIEKKNELLYGKLFNAGNYWAQI